MGGNQLCGLWSSANDREPPTVGVNIPQPTRFFTQALGDDSDEGACQFEWGRPSQPPGRRHPLMIHAWSPGATSWSTLAAR